MPLSPPLSLSPAPAFLCLRPDFSVSGPTLIPAHAAPITNLEPGVSLSPTSQSRVGPTHNDVGHLVPFREEGLSQFSPIKIRSL